MKNRILERSFLLFAVFFVFSLHMYYITELYYDHDIPAVAYNTLDIMNGRGWYHSVWQPKPPGINFIYLAAFNILGRSFKSIYIFALLFDLASIMLLYFFAKKAYSQKIKFYYLLPLFYALLCVAEPLHGYTANAEKFFIPFEIAAILLIFLRYHFLAGFALGMGFLVKQHAIAAFIAGGIYIIFSNIWRKNGLRNLVKDISFFAGAFAVPLLIISLYFLKLGVFGKFIDYTFIYNIRGGAEYLTSVRDPYLPYALKTTWGSLRPEIIFFTLLSILGFCFSLVKPDRVKSLAAVWFFVVCVFLLKTAVYKHHFMQLVAPLCCVSVIGLSASYEGICNLFKKKKVPGNLFIMFAAVTLLSLFLHLTMTQITRNMQDIFWPGAQNRFDCARYLRAHTVKDDKIFAWDGASIGAIFLGSDRGGVGNFTEKYSLLPRNLRKAYGYEYWMPSAGDYKLNQQQLLSDLNKETPAYIVIVREPLLEEEKGAFYDFFSVLLPRDYFLEKEIGICLVYKKITR